MQRVGKSPLGQDEGMQNAQRQDKGQCGRETERRSGYSGMNLEADLVRLGLLEQVQDSELYP